MSLFVNSDDSFLAYVNQKSSVGGIMPAPGDKRSVPKIISHSLAFNSERVGKNYINGRRTENDSTEVGGVVSGDIVIPASGSDLVNRMLTHVFRSKFGATNGYRQFRENMMGVHSKSLWRTMFESVSYKNASESVVQRFMGCHFTGLTYNIVPQQTPTITGTLLGFELNKETDGERRKINFKKIGAHTYVRDNSPTIPAHNYSFRLMTEGNSLIDDFAFSSVEMSLATDAEAQYKVGRKVAQDLRLGTFTAAINAAIYAVPATSQLFTMYRDNQPLRAEIRYTGSGAGHSFTFPRMFINSMSEPLTGPNSTVFNNISLTASDENWWYSPVLVKRHSAN